MPCFHPSVLLLLCAEEKDTRTVLQAAAVLFFCLHTDERQEQVIACGCARQHIVSVLVLNRWVKGRALSRQGGMPCKNKSIAVLLDFKYSLDFFCRRPW